MHSQYTCLYIFFVFTGDMQIAMRVFGAARTPYLMYEVYINDSLHGVRFPKVHTFIFINNHKPQFYDWKNQV